MDAPRVDLLGESVHGDGSSIPSWNRRKEDDVYVPGEPVCIDTEGTWQKSDLLLVQVELSPGGAATSKAMQTLGRDSGGRREYIYVLENDLKTVEDLGTRFRKNMDRVFTGGEGI